MLRGGMALLQEENDHVGFGSLPAQQLFCARQACAFWERTKPRHGCAGALGQDKSLYNDIALLEVQESLSAVGLNRKRGKPPRGKPSLRLKRVLRGCVVLLLLGA